MKKTRVAILGIAIIFFLMLSFVIGTGFTKNPNVVLIDYSVSDDGKEIRFNVGVPLRANQIRGFKNVGGGVKPHYLNFYHTFGVVSSWGANYEYMLELNEDDSEIYFNRADGGYELVLEKKTDTGEWVIP